MCSIGSNYKQVDMTYKQVPNIIILIFNKSYIIYEYYHKYN